MKHKNFVAFILSHGRADNVVTYNTLKKQGYTGKIIIVIDTDDNQQQKYIDNFGKENIYIFDKNDIKQDKFDNLDNRKVIFFARNVCFDIAQKLGYRYFIQLDDDYTGFYCGGNLKGKNITQDIRINVDVAFDYMIDLLNLSPNFYSICMLQGGDFFDRKRYYLNLHLHKKAMNSFVCDVNKRFDFIGRVNEDVNTVNHLSSLGKFLLSVSFLSLEQKQTQANKGGMTEQYLDNGTYVKSFYSIINNPSAIKIHTMGLVNARIHHQVNRKNCWVQILGSEYAD